MVAVPNLGSFVRALFPVRMTGGYCLTYGVWVGVEPPDMERVFAEWWAPTYPQTDFAGSLGERNSAVGSARVSGSARSA